MAKKREMIEELVFRDRANYSLDVFFSPNKFRWLNHPLSLGDDDSILGSINDLPTFSTT